MTERSFACFTCVQSVLLRSCPPSEAHRRLRGAAASGRTVDPATIGRLTFGDMMALDRQA